MYVWTDICPNLKYVVANLYLWEKELDDCIMVKLNIIIQGYLTNTALLSAKHLNLWCGPHIPTHGSSYIVLISTYLTWTLPQEQLYHRH